jgi:RNA polymerase sigma-70 factor (ECF subfamily)
MVQDPDRELLQRCQTVGSQEFEAGFRDLYGKYKDRVYGLAFRITGNSADALDAAQEAFVLLYQNVHTFQFDSKFSSWLYRLVVNASIDHLRRTRTRRHSRETAIDTEALDQHSDSSLPEPSAVAESADLAERIQANILKLSPKLRTVIVLRYQNGLSYEDLADTLEISLGTVKSRLARAHIALASMLKPLMAGCEHPGSESKEQPQP